MSEADFDAAAKLLEEAEWILFITGAGISVDSGLSAYRGKGGIYDGTTPEEDIPIEEVMSFGMFEKRPEPGHNTGVASQISKRRSRIGRMKSSLN